MKKYALQFLTALCAMLAVFSVCALAETPETTLSPAKKREVSIPVTVEIEKKGLYLPDTDTTFYFELRGGASGEYGEPLTWRENGAEFRFNGKELWANDNGYLSFSMTVAAGEKSASGTLEISNLPANDFGGTGGSFAAVIWQFQPSGAQNRWVYDSEQILFTISWGADWDAYYMAEKVKTYPEVGAFPTDAGLEKGAELAFFNEYTDNDERVEEVVPELPQTGDDAKLVVWFAMLAAVAFCAIAAGVHSMKKKA